VKPAFFASPALLRRWFERHHARHTELLIGFHKKGSGRPSVTYSEALDEALCVGWIDGVRRSIDSESYTIRFTPRKPVSHWSAVNRRRAAALEAEGRLKPAGVAAFERRGLKATRKYSFENKPARLAPSFEKRFRANARAWAFFVAQPPGYRRTVTFYVMSAVKDETKARRLTTLIEDSEAQRRLGILARPLKPRTP
jgi:uncharacterized protein YdeI (YjbR/CyaY-like superfamily)